MTDWLTLMLCCQAVGSVPWCSCSLCCFAFRSFWALAVSEVRCRILSLEPDTCTAVKHLTVPHESWVPRSADKAFLNHSTVRGSLFWPTDHYTQETSQVAIERGLWLRGGCGFSCFLFHSFDALSFVALLALCAVAFCLLDDEDQTSHSSLWSEVKIALYVFRSYLSLQFGMTDTDWRCVTKQLVVYGGAVAVRVVLHSDHSGLLLCLKCVAGFWVWNLTPVLLSNTWLFHMKVGCRAVQTKLSWITPRWEAICSGLLTTILRRQVKLRLRVVCDWEVVVDSLVSFSILLTQCHLLPCLLCVHALSACSPDDEDQTSHSSLWSEVKIALYVFRSYLSLQFGMTDTDSRCVAKQLVVYGGAVAVCVVLHSDHSGLLLCLKCVAGFWVWNLTPVLLSNTWLFHMKVGCRAVQTKLSWITPRWEAICSGLLTTILRRQVKLRLRVVCDWEVVVDSLVSFSILLTHCHLLPCLLCVQSLSAC